MSICLFALAITEVLRKFLLCADMRSDVQAIFKLTPHDKQVMMFSATLNNDIRPVCKKFMSDVRTQPAGLPFCSLSAVQNPPSPLLTLKAHLPGGQAVTAR